MNESVVIETAEKFFFALADKTRLRILNLIKDDEVCVCFFTEALQESQPKISRHLAYLRDAGLVKTRREGKWIHYSIVFPEDDAQADILDATLQWAAQQDVMRVDIARMADIIGQADDFSTIARAPKPESFAAFATKQAYEEIDEFLL